MKANSHKILCLLLAAALLAALSAPAALAAGETVHLRTAEDLKDFSQRCTLDSWSQGKTVYLDADIDLTGEDFSPIPTFGGTFQGQGHAISGLSITGSGNVRGLFRYIQPGAAVYDLTVKGVIDPSGRKDTLGLLAGENRGTLSGCEAVGSSAGTDRIGGLVGVNEAEGQIINCSFSGSVIGEHYAGGIAGQNYGTIIQCSNSGSINTTEVDAEINLEDLNREQLNAAENAPVCTDIGGITGYSAGILQSCVNSGAVGYAHVGYNIGGIAGRQSGYLDSCSNSGTILGRKDVGGIAGQLEPEIRLLYDQGDLGTLLDDLDQLQNLLEQTGGDLRSTSDALSGQMDAVSARADEVREAVDGLAGTASGWADDTIGQINSLSARISWLIQRLTPILEDTVDVMDLAEELAVQLDKAMEETGGAAEAGEQGLRALQTVAQDLRQAAGSGKAAAADLRSALEHLEKALGNAGQSQEAIDEVRTAVGALSDALRGMGQALRSMAELLQNGGDQAALADAARALAETLMQAAGAAEQAVTAVADCLDAQELSAAAEAAASALENLEQAAQALDTAAGHAADAAALLPGLSEQLETLCEAFRRSGKVLEQLTSRGAAVGADLAGVFADLSQMPSIVLRPIDSTMREQGEAVSDAFAQLLDEGNTLRETMASGTEALLEDLDRINSQLGVITDDLRRLLEGSSQEPADRFEDVSDQDSGTTGTISNARNTGSVQGDLDVAGIAGSMAIEYDFDPEDDLIREGDRSLDFRYQTRAVIRSSVNTGAVTGKQDYAGGTVGRMDLGRVSGCENYGCVTSTGGDYVGGIAGASWGSIRDCWSRCHLSGGDYVGGIAGLGATLTGCRVLASIDEGAAFLGAVAGNVSDGGTVSGNLFVGDTPGGLDGISYTGRAEPVDFDALCAEPDAPAEFSRLELTFVADGVTVAVVPFQYGEGLDTLPEIPAKKDCSAAWPDLDYTHLTASQTLEAIYTPYTSALTDGGALPEILVDGSFSSQASVSHTSEETSWTDKNGAVHTGTAYTVTVEDPDLEQVSYTVHCRLPDTGKHYRLWVREGDDWVQTEAQIDGQYLLLHSQESTITFCVAEAPCSWLLWVLTAAGLLLLAGAVHLIIRKRKQHH